MTREQILSRLNEWNESRVLKPLSLELTFEVYQFIKNLPEELHSHWIPYDRTGTNDITCDKCFVCGYISANQTKYCPDCGAFMDNSPFHRFRHNLNDD